MKIEQTEDELIIRASLSEVSIVADVAYRVSAAGTPEKTHACLTLRFDPKAKAYYVLSLPEGLQSVGKEDQLPVIVVQEPPALPPLDAGYEVACGSGI